MMPALSSPAALRASRATAASFLLLRALLATLALSASLLVLSSSSFSPMTGADAAALSARATTSTFASAVASLAVNSSGASDVSLSTSVARVAPSSANPQSFNAYYTDSNLADIQWANDKVLFMLTFDSRCYRSTNGGRSWEDEQADMNAVGVRIRQIRISPHDPKAIFFLGEHGHHIATRYDYSHISKQDHWSIRYIF